MRPKIKICGVRRVADALLAVDLGATHIGCVLAPDSPRCATLNEARELVAAVGSSAQVVLVFRNPSVEEVVETLGNDVRAHTAVPTALYAFLSHSGSFKEAVVYAVSLGGDTDTIGAMTGAIAGAYHGVEAIPRGWLDALENESKGRDYVLDMAARLYDRHLELRS